VLSGDINGSRYFKRSVPLLTYSDGVVSIRRQEMVDLDAELAGKDDEQMDWLWLPGQREVWQAMTFDKQRSHALRILKANHDSFGLGPKWCFTIDSQEVPCVGYVDCDLANPNVPPGVANISYASHPGYRGRGLVSRAVRLVKRFLADSTGAREAHLIVDPLNEPSIRVASAVGAMPIEQWQDARGHTLIRHIVLLRGG
jgi:RimJ/RimL family protein N-acetyltransferase